MQGDRRRRQKAAHESDQYEWEEREMKGFSARYLEVDLGSGDISVKELEEELFRKYIGGTGLAAYLFLKEMAIEANFPFR